jgi:alkyl sulfatase BDS1-like metallo-beta-lactamase superfamily hydrolase
MKRNPPELLLLCTLFATACDRPLPQETGADERGHTAPTAATIAANRAVLEALDFSERQDFEDATRGLIASDPALRVVAADGSPVWDLPANAFIEGEAPDSVNPSRWRQARLNNIHGLFEVTDGVEFIFQNAPGSEAPAELTFYLPHVKAFNGAEVTSHNLHNLYTLDLLKFFSLFDKPEGRFDIVTP